MEKLELIFDTACNWYSNETVKKYKNMRKWMVEFLRKFMVIKLLEFIAPNQSFYLGAKLHQINEFILNLHCVGIRCDGGRFSVHSQFIEKFIHQRNTTSNWHRL